MTVIACAHQSGQVALDLILLILCNERLSLGGSDLPS